MGSKAPLSKTTGGVLLRKLRLDLILNKEIMLLNSLLNKAIRS
jgi:hypothetical protein